MTRRDPKDTRTAGPINGLAVASLVLGILWVMWLGSILALIFGYMARNQIDRSSQPQSGRALAVAGIVLGWVGVGTLALMTTLAMTGVMVMPNMPMSGSGGDDEFSSSGERIFMTSTSDSGDSITYEQGPGEGMMFGLLACADCHGADGQGDKG